MRNGFGFKDLVTIALLLAVAVSVWLSMVQRDRQWELLQKVDGRIADLEKRIQQIRVAPAATAVTTAAAAPRDDAWARPGVKIERWNAPAPATDPTKIPGFASGGEFTELFEAQPAKLVPYISSD
ncbi:MAG: hypothetical protein ACKPEA_15980, partial [Planctomycetota bacterium]